MIGDSNTSQMELRRILWRQGVLRTSKGVEFLASKAMLREKDVGENLTEEFKRFST